MKKFVLCFSFLFFTLPAISHSEIKPFGFVTNGGDGVCAEFLRIFDNLVVALKSVPLEQEQKQMVEAMIEKRKIVELASEPFLSLNGIAKDAINQPDLPIPKITISQASWARLSLVQKNHLVLHEMLPVANYPDQDYARSSSLMNRTILGINSFHEIWSAIVSCNPNELKRILISDLIRVKDDNLPHVAITGGLCVEAIEMLANANWDFNRCDYEQKATALTVVKRFKENGWQEGPFFEKASKIERLIQEHGGTETCSDFYPPTLYEREPI